MLPDWGLSQVFCIRYLSSSFERWCKQEGRENAQFYFCDFGKRWKTAVLWIIVSLYKAVLRTTHSSRSSFMFLLPVVLKQLMLLFNREQAVCVAHNMYAALKPMFVVFKDLQCVVPSNGETWKINHGGGSRICLMVPSWPGFAGCSVCARWPSCSGVPWRSFIHKTGLDWSYLGLQSCCQKAG